MSRTLMLGDLLGEFGGPPLFVVSQTFHGTHFCDGSECGGGIHKACVIAQEVGVLAHRRCKLEHTVEGGVEAHVTSRTIILRLYLAQCNFLRLIVLVC
jgi:hypothetical protein